MTRDRRHTALWAGLTAVYLFAYLGTTSGRGGDRLDPVGPAARQVERAIRSQRFADALPVALDAREAYPGDPLPSLWLGHIYRGLGRPADEAAAWEAFAALSGARDETCALVVGSYARFGDLSGAGQWQHRCEGASGHGGDRR